VANVLSSFLIFNIVGPLNRKGFLKRIPIKVSFYSKALVLIPRREYLLPR